MTLIVVCRSNPRVGARRGAEARVHVCVAGRETHSNLTTPSERQAASPIMLDPVCRCNHKWAPRGLAVGDSGVQPHSYLKPQEVVLHHKAG